MPVATDAQRQAVAARERCKSERGVWAHKQRMADAEGVIRELKNHHGLDRVRWPTKRLSARGLREIDGDTVAMRRARSRVRRDHPQLDRKLIFGV